MKQLLIILLIPLLSISQDSTIRKLCDDDYLQIHPANYDESAKQGMFTIAVREFPGVNGYGMRSNVVGSFWGYNTNPGGGQRIPGEASYRFAGETHYDAGSGPLFELHLPDVYTNSGLNVRPFSMYINKSTGVGSANFQMQQFNFKKVNNASVDWMRIYNDAGAVRIELKPESGDSYFEMNSNGNRSYIVNGGGGLSFNNSIGAFRFNNPIVMQGGCYSAGIYSDNRTLGINISNSLQGHSSQSRLLIVGDEKYSEKFYITPTLIVNTLEFVNLNDFTMAGTFRPYGTRDLKFQTHPSADVDFFIGDEPVLNINDGGVVAKSISTGNAKIKIGDVANGYLILQINGSSYKLKIENN